MASLDAEARGDLDELELGSWCYFGMALGLVGWGASLFGFVEYLQYGLVRGELAPCENITIQVSKLFTVWGGGWPSGNGQREGFTDLIDHR